MNAHLLCPDTLAWPAASASVLQTLRSLAARARFPCAGGGLSSSAAIVCASALAVMRMHGIELTKGVRPPPPPPLPRCQRPPAPARPPAPWRRHPHCRRGRVELRFHCLLICAGHHDRAWPGAVAAGCSHAHQPRPLPHHAPCPAAAQAHPRAHPLSPTAPHRCSCAARAAGVRHSRPLSARPSCVPLGCLL